MRLDINKEIDDIVAVAPAARPNRMVIGFVASATILSALVVAWITGILYLPPTHGSPATTDGSSRPVDLKIKGNRKSRIYHLPGCPNYDDISPRNIIWFTTHEEAKGAGFRMARNC
jgi:hypothetical protein